MSKSVYLVVGSFLLFIFVAAATLQSMVVMQRIASVSDVQGDVKIKHRSSAAFYPLGVARFVRAGDIMQTGDGSLTLNWVDGARVKLGPGTTLQVLKCQINSATNAAVSVFKLDVGQVWVRVRKLLNPRSKFEVLTPTATAGVRGTMFSVKVDPRGDTQVSVLEGRVVVQNQDSDQAIAVDHGQCGRIEKAPAQAQSPMEVTLLSPAELEAWKQARGLEGPFLVISRPAYDTCHLTEQGVVKVAGLAEESAVVTVNRQAAKRGAGGRFFAQVPAQPGQTLKIEVTAEDPHGLRTTLRRDVTVASSPGS
jgi:hypothetical protein